MDSPYAQELTVAIGALQNAARLSQSIISLKIGIIEKQDLSPVTVADFAVQALLTATIKDAFPGDRVVGEEDASDLRKNSVLLEQVWELLSQIDGEGCKIPSSIDHLLDLIDECGSSSPGGKESGRTWIIDPIDGTKSYLKKSLYAINMGLLLDGQQVVGVVAAPNMPLNATTPLRNENIDPTGCILFAVRDYGAYIRPFIGSDIQTKKLARHAEGQDVRFVTCTNLVDSALDGVHEVVAERLKADFPGCDLVAWVLRWASLSIGLANTTVWVYKRKDRYAKAWDHAGAMLLYEETGGKITDVRGNPIDLTAGRKLSANFGFVAAPADLHGKVLRTVHDVLREQGRQELLEL